MFSEDRARFYAAEILLAIECLHKHDVIYRDLKPENVILDSQGHIKITDFGLSKQAVTAKENTYSFCGTPEYLAPEIITGEGHHKSADWWSFGALLYEMLCGRPPHYSSNRKQMVRDIVEKDIYYPPIIDVEARSLLRKLLCKDKEKRLGSGEKGVDEIKQHAFFSTVDWGKML